MKRILLSIGVLAWVLAGAPRLQAQTGNTSGPPPAAAVGTDEDYVIGADDILDISVWKEPDISRKVPVRSDGKISLPLLNDIMAAGLTPMQLQAQITEKLRKFLTEPQVTVTVLATNSRRVYIMGEVAKPGPIPLLSKMTVLQAITTAGGLGQFANGSKIRVLRNENGKQVVFSFNYKEVLAGRNPEQNIILKPGDSIVVP
jgi:polysaccharide export outer membrane protein